MLRYRAFALLVLATVTSGCTPSAAPVTSPQAEPLPTTSRTLEHGEDAQDDSPTPALAEANTVAARFAHAWARPEADSQTWWDGVAFWCEEGLADKLRSVEPGNIPATTVTGPPQHTGGSAADGLRFHIPTNAGTLQVTIAALGDQWKVTTIDFDRSPQ